MSVTLADWNGEVMPLEDVRVSVLDRAFLFGDGIYEALRFTAGGRSSFANIWTGSKQSARNLD